MAFLWRNLENAVSSCIGGKSLGRYEPREDDEEPGLVGRAVHRWQNSEPTSSSDKAGATDNRIFGKGCGQEHNDTSRKKGGASHATNTKSTPSAGGGKVAAPTTKRNSKPTTSSRPSSSCSACHGRIYPTDAPIQSFGETLHASCFKCLLCHKKMLRHPLEVQFRLPDDVDNDVAHQNDDTHDDGGDDELGSRLVFLCSKCQETSIASHKEKRLSTTAGQRIEIDSHEEGNVDDVMDAIGDELEEIMLDNVPKCSSCGRDFLTYRGEVKMVGMAKYHKECFEYGGGRHQRKSGGGGIDSPPGKEEERELTPLQALQHLPERIIVKLSTPATSWSTSASNKPLVTLFFEWSTRVADLKRLRGSSNYYKPRGGGAAASSSSGTAEMMISAGYGLDAKAALRKKQVVLDSSAGGLVIPELVGCDEVFPGYVAEKMDDKNSDFCSFRLSCVRYQRRHLLTLRIRKVRSNTTTNDNADDGGGGGGVRFALDLASALLKVEIES